MSNTNDLRDKYSKQNRITFIAGTNLGKYTIEKLLGQGGYGDVYSVIDQETNKNYAIKTEYNESPKKGLQNEIKILNSINYEGFPRVYDTEKLSKVSFYVMDLFSYSLIVYKRKCLVTKIRLQLLVNIAKHTLKLIEKLHGFGYIHRDIKLSNFLFNRSQDFPICLIDFGLAESYLDPVTNQPLPQKPAKFMGTLKYASVNAHHNLSLGRKDDLISWFYSIVELYQKRLPWSSISDNEEVCEMKENLDLADFCSGLPEAFVDIYKYIIDLGFEENPDYKMMNDLLSNCIDLGHINWIGLINSIENIIHPSYNGGAGEYRSETRSGVSVFYMDEIKEEEEDTGYDNYDRYREQRYDSAGDCCILI